MTAILALSMLLAIDTAQQESKPVPKDSVEVEARGCLKGRVFTATGRVGEEGASRGPDIIGRSFRVTAKREVMDQVKRHDRHLVEVVGIVRKSALGDEGLGMRIGPNARVVIGQGRGDPTRSDARTQSAGVPTMDVTGLRVVSDTCPFQ